MELSKEDNPILVPFAHIRAKLPHLANKCAISQIRFEINFVDSIDNLNCQKCKKENC